MAATTELTGNGVKEARTSGMIYVFKKLVRNRLAAVGLIMILIIILCAALAPILAPYDPGAADGYRSLMPPDGENLLGTNEMGQDILSRLIYGSRITLLVALASVGITLVIGVPLGLISGYVGGRVDTVIMRLMDAMYAFPPMLLALALVAGLGPSISNVIIAVGIVMIPTFCRLSRAQALSAREQTYVIAARTSGASMLRILGMHIWPNITASIIVQASVGMAWAILAESSLSYLGVGVRPPTATWGVMLAEGFQYLQIFPLQSIIPGMAIFITVLSLNLVGDALRDVLDPRLRGTI